METLAPFWSRDPCDPVGQSGLGASALWDPQFVENSAPSVSCSLWTELSPHLQRNKQLHDTLLQREEELARLQEENNKLRQFLNSSFVKDLEEKAKKLCLEGRRKRTSFSSDAPISKRVCRNLSAVFCSESEPSEETLDLWVLKTLGLKDKDTIDTATDNHVPVTDHYHSPINTNTDIYHSPVTANTLQGECQDTRDSCHFPTSVTMTKSRFVHQETRDCSVPLQTSISYSPLKRLHFSCSSPKKSGTNQNGGGVISPTKSPCGPGTPTSQDLAFSMYLSPNHSLKTHSFAHGQAFVRRDTQGRCSFTWVPRERP